MAEELNSKFLPGTLLIGLEIFEFRGHLIGLTRPDGGGAEMVIFETAGRGQVFSTGSVNYILSLLVDEHVSLITRNVLTGFLEERD